MTGITHYESVLRDIDIRIGRQAIACGIDVSKREIVDALVSGDFARCHCVEGPFTRDLRGLLMLKIHIVDSCLKELGMQACVLTLERADHGACAKGFHVAL